jgi:hypothetical protein
MSFDDADIAAALESSSLERTDVPQFDPLVDDATLIGLDFGASHLVTALASGEVVLDP